MATKNSQRKKPAAARKATKRERSQPAASEEHRDKVEPTGVYPTSGPWPEGDAEFKGMASRGQGERGAAGYEDHGDSELNLAPAAADDDEAEDGEAPNQAARGA